MSDGINGTLTHYEYEFSAADRMTDKGVRSSWEAAATNRACFCWFSAMGFSRMPVKNQAKTPSRMVAAMSISSFQNDINTISTNLEQQNVISMEWLSKMEAQGNYRFFVYTQQNGSGNVDQQKADALLLHLQFQPLQRRKHHHLQHRTARTELDHTAEIPCFR